MRGDHHAAFGALLRHQVAQQLQAQAVRQAHVGDHGVKTVFLQLLARLRQVTGRFNPVAFAQQGEFIKRAQVRLIVNHQDVCRLWIGAAACWGHGFQADKAPSEAGFAVAVGAPGLKTTKNSLPSTAWRMARW